MIKEIMKKLGDSVDIDTEFTIPIFGTDKELYIKAHTQRRGETRYIIRKNPIYTGLSDTIKGCEKVKDGHECPISKDSE